VSETARRSLVIGNWKMNLSGEEAERLVDAVVIEVGGGLSTEVAVAPPFPYLGRVAGRTRGTPVRVGAQDVHWESHGAFTGAVSPPMLLDVGASFAIVGHSERRTHFRETDEEVAKKASAAARAGLDVVVCVGETEAERDRGDAVPVVGRQVWAAVGRLDAASLARVTLAYEPVWAIGTGRTPTEDEIREVHRSIRALVTAVSADFGAAARILYGGSVTPDNAAGILALGDVDGTLVGGASLHADRFLAIARAAALPGPSPA
jgi:triosephosphate isomerase